MDVRPRIVNDENIDEEKYAYALCECRPLGMGAIEIDRDETDDGLVVFNCPSCGKKLGLFVASKKRVALRYF